MIKLMGILLEASEESEEVQTYIDIISDDPDNPRMDKYKKALKDKHGIDFDDVYNDDSFIKNASLDNIKKKSDFNSFDNYQKYASKIFQLRGLAEKQPYHIDKQLTFDEVTRIVSPLGVKTERHEYTGTGNYAQVQHNSAVLEIPTVIDVNTLIHELGHVYDGQHYPNGGISRTITYASSPYGVGLTNEVFAENFMHYFIAPEWLRRNLSDVYDDLDAQISDQWKRVIRSML